ncbi:hypothetical protein DRP43_03095 [candidate division TA06 bacterium]|uniref:Leucine-binding protein domain-containing protein n=1 Tax=candidate division TA06 bacterium TaxID=2250710 RepID=A0A660SIV4_UNCT6|nr:MAG: hypothetical protein DRP43_03095 [candidate division TA06 bacterium]
MKYFYFIISIVILIFLQSCRFEPGKEISYQSEFGQDIRKVRSLILNDKYKKAEKLISDLSKKYDETNYLNQISYYKALLYYKKGKYTHSDSILDQLKTVKVHKDEFLFLRADNRFHLNDWYKSYKLFIKLQKSKEYGNLSRKKINDILKKSNDKEFIEIVLLQAKGIKYTDKELYLIIKRLHSLNENSLKSFYIKQLKRLYADSEIIKLIAPYEEKVKLKDIRITLLLPFSNIGSKSAMDFLNGFKLAIDFEQLNIALYDTKGDPIETYLGLKKQFLKNKPDIVIGPLFSMSSIAASILSNEEDVPIVLPMAKDIRISSIGENVFQFGKGFGEEANILVDYLVKSNIKTAAIFNVNTTKGLDEKKAFETLFKSKGGKIIREEFYSKNETDFSVQMESLKVVYDSIGYDVIFINGSPDNLIMAATQLKYYGIGARIVGLNEWGDNKVVRLASAYIDSVIYAKEKWVGQELLKKTITKEYRKKYKISPGIASFYGYDAGLLIKSLKNRKKLKNELKNMEGLWGTTGYISLNDNILPPDIYIYTIINGVSKRIK